jgi:cytochrome c-type biogenesis protein
MLHALLFVAGLTFVFVVVIGGLAGAMSVFLRENKREVQYVMGAVLVVFGLHMMGAINLPFMNYTRRLEMRTSQNVSFLRSLLIGMAFGIGWTPCIGPVLSSIFALSLSGREGEAFPLFLAYALGLGLPFLITALATGQIAGWLKKLTRRSFTFKIGRFTVLRQVNVISLVSGLLLIFMGLLIFTNSLALIAPQINWFEGI